MEAGEGGRILETVLRMIMEILLLLLIVAILGAIAWKLSGCNRQPKIRLNIQVGRPEPKDPVEGKQHDRNKDNERTEG